MMFHVQACQLPERLVWNRRYRGRRTENARSRFELLNVFAIVVVEGVEITCNQRNVIVTPPESFNILPAADLSFQAEPISGKLFVAPMNFSAMAGNAMRRIQQLTA